MKWNWDIDNKCLPTFYVLKTLKGQYTSKHTDVQITVINILIVNVKEQLFNWCLSPHAVAWGWKCLV